MDNTDLLLPRLTAGRVALGIAIVAEAFNVDPGQVQTAQRGIAAVTRARQALYAILYRQTNAGYKGLGNALHRDHTTCMHGVQQVETVWPEKLPAYYAGYTQARIAFASHLRSEQVQA